MAEFDVKQVSTYQWMGIGAGALAFINSFLPWWSVSFDGPMEIPGASGSLNQWDVGFLGWFSLLLVIAAAVIAALPLFGVSIPNGTLIWAGLAGLASVLILIRWLTYDSASGITDAAGVSAGASFGTIVGLILALVATVGGFLAFRGASTSTTDKAA